MPQSTNDKTRSQISETAEVLDRDQTMKIIKLSCKTNTTDKS